MVFALLLFLVSFVVLSIWALRKPDGEIEELELLPLEDEGKYKQENGNEQRKTGQ